MGCGIYWRAGQAVTSQLPADWELVIQGAVVKSVAGPCCLRRPMLCCGSLR
jgi:hypothetical protein